MRRNFYKMGAICLTGLMLTLAACGGKGENAPEDNNTNVTTQTQGNGASDNTGTTGNTSTAGNAAGTSTGTGETAGTQGSETSGAAQGTESSKGENLSQPVYEANLTVETEVAGGCQLTEDHIYTFVKGGEYVISGNQTEGRIVVDAGEEQVTLVFNGVWISSTENSVIYVKSADEVTIKAQGGSVNVLNDNRPLQTQEEADDSIGSACIYAKADLSFVGKGTLTVNATYNNGIHTKDDIDIKNLTLNVTAPNNAIKGNDSITIKSGVITVVSTAGDGLKTTNTDISSKGKQRGIIAIESGTVTITAADKGIKAAYSVEITEDETTSVTVNGAKYVKEK